MTGTGTAIPLLSTTIRTTTAGIWPTTRELAPTSTPNISAPASTRALVAQPFLAVLLRFRRIVQSPSETEVSFSRPHSPNHRQPQHASPCNPHIPFLRTLLPNHSNIPACPDSS